MFHKIQKKWKEWFSFDQGVDIANDTEVLYRRNIVVKNIIFLSNLVYTIISFLITLTDKQAGNFIFTFLFLPLTFIMNLFLKKVSKDKTNFFKQEVAMYIGCAYMFVSAVTLYLRFMVGSRETVGYLEFSGYLLILFSLVVVSLYQDKKLLRNVYPVFFILITILHFTVTYPIYEAEYASDLSKLSVALSDPNIKDIILRTVIVILFMIVLYTIASIGQYMQSKRKEELIKRIETQKSFANIVGELFQVSNDNKGVNREELRYNNLVSSMTKYLAGLVGINEKDCQALVEYSRIHIDQRNKLTLLQTKNYENLDEEQFEELQLQTSLGAKIVKRLQLRQKCEDIVRAHIEGFNDETFVEDMNHIQNNQGSQIILLCDMYVTLRSARSYKRPYPHHLVMDNMTKEFRVYFDELVFDRFVKYHKEFETMFNQYAS